MKRFIAAIAGLLLLCSCTLKPQRKDDIYIFFTSDVHCGVEENVGMASLKALVDDTRAEHEYVTLVDTGDFLQGGTMGSLSRGELIISLMNKMGYELATFGNHEFDYGMDTLKQRVSEADFQMIASNTEYSGSGESVFAGLPEYVIKDYGGTKVAFLGVLTPESLTSSTPKFFMENDEFVYGFYGGQGGERLYEKVQSVVDEARKAGADYVVALTHLRSVVEYAPYDSISLISHTSGIDAVLDGHSHSLITGDMYPNKEGKDVLLSSVGTKMEAVGELIIDTEGNFTALHIEEYGKADETIAADIEEAKAQIDVILAEKVCDLDYDINITDEEGIRISRSRETTAGNYIADAFRYVMDCDIGMTNGGGVRSNISAGEVTYGDLLSVTPFQNNVASCYATGRQIVDMLEFGCRSTQGIYSFEGNAVGENGAFLCVSNLKYTIDVSVESPVQLDENGVFTGFAEGERRVKDVMVYENGEYVPIDPEKVYTVAGTSYFLFNSGDGNTIMKDCEKIVETGMTDVEAQRAYLEATGGFGDRYRDIEGRITIVQ